MVVKRDMTKAYNRVFWIYLTRVLTKFYFSEAIIDMVWRLLANNEYSLLVSRQSHGLFQSIRDLKQDDSLSPTLYIIAAELLSIGLNSLRLDYGVHNSTTWHMQMA